MKIYAIKRDTPELVTSYSRLALVRTILIDLGNLLRCGTWFENVESFYRQFHLVWSKQMSGYTSCLHPDSIYLNGVSINESKYGSNRTVFNGTPF
jgi:hypothetical protein